MGVNLCQCVLFYTAPKICGLHEHPFQNRKNLIIVTKRSIQGGTI